MADGGANDDAGRQREEAPGSDDAVEPLRLDDPTDESANGPTDGSPSGSPEGDDGHHNRRGSTKTPDLELVEPVELDIPADEFPERSTDGSTPSVANHGASSRDAPATIGGEQLLSALVDALRDERFDAQVAALRGELAVDPNPELGSRMDRLEAVVAERNVEKRVKRLEVAVEERNVEARLDRLEAAVEKLASRVATDGSHDQKPSAKPVGRGDLHEELAEVRTGLEKLAMHVNERTATIESLESHVEELRQWQQAVRAVAAQPEKD